MIDVNKVTFIDRLECSCGFTETYARSMAYEPVMQCPSCNSKSVYVSIEFGRDDSAPVQPNQVGNLSIYQSLTLGQLAELLFEAEERENLYNTCDDFDYNEHSEEWSDINDPEDNEGEEWKS